MESATYVTDGLLVFKLALPRLCSLTTAQEVKSG